MLPFWDPYANFRGQFAEFLKNASVITLVFSTFPLVLVLVQFLISILSRPFFNGVIVDVPIIFFLRFNLGTDSPNFDYQTRWKPGDFGESIFHGFRVTHTCIITFDLSYF